MQNLNEVKLYTSFYQSGNLITPRSLWECTMHAWSFNPQVIKIYFLVVLPRQLSGDENTYTNQLGDIVLMHGQILRTNANLTCDTQWQELVFSAWDLLKDFSMI